MTRKTASTLLALACALGFALPPAAAETLRVGTECTYFPFNYREAGGELKGYDVDVANEIGKRIGATIDFVCQDWDGMIPALLANKFDIIVASMSITAARMERIDFSTPYRVSIGQFVAPKASAYNFFNADGTVNPASLKGVRVGLERATTYDNWFAAKVPEVEVVRYDDNQSMYLDLKAGRIDTMMTNPMKTYLEFLSKEDGAGFEVVGPQIKDEEHFGTGVGIGVRKGNDELLKRLDAALEAMMKDRTLSTFSRRYFPFDIYPQDWKGAS